MYLLNNVNNRATLLQSILRCTVIKDLGTTNSKWHHFFLLNHPEPLRIQDTHAKHSTHDFQVKTCLHLRSGSINRRNRTGKSVSGAQVTCSTVEKRSTHRFFRSSGSLLTAVRDTACPKTSFVPRDVRCVPRAPRSGASVLGSEDDVEDLWTRRSAAGESLRN